jgi:hypothetical protein
MLRIPYFLHNRRVLLPKSWYSFLLEDESIPWPQCDWEGLDKVKEKIQSIISSGLQPAPFRHGMHPRLERATRKCSYGMKLNSLWANFNHSRVVFSTEQAPIIMLILYLVTNKIKIILERVLCWIPIRWVPVATAWCVFGLRLEKRPPAMEGSCEYNE